MKKTSLALLLLFSICNVLAAQNIKVQPYLQDASPNSIFILWETDTADESMVEWGLTEALGNTATGTSAISEGEARIHEVKLENLDRFTTYFYRVKTPNVASAISTFKTPPFASDQESFRIVAMSDMQRDGSFPDKFSEIIHEGVLDYLSNEFGGEPIDNLALVLIPGDLVQNGNSYAQWENQFFEPAQDLFNQVPVYPVLGNHESNAAYYFSYFKLPENGAEGWEEHCWYKDYGNVRIIGLDSNISGSFSTQLDWLDTVLDQACASDSIDFVFAQLHHPHKSELWTPGESDFTGDVIDRMEGFSTACDKPSIHFFGHTHGYSRGQSRDHKHLWINVASAGGAIDNWGEFPNFDYDEFSVSQDEYGFVMLEITDDEDPKIVIKRISRGDQDATKENEMTDSLILRLKPSTVEIPIPIFPVDIEVAPECVTLQADVFSSSNTSAVHGQSHWQVSVDENDFSQAVAESWKNFENWYFDIDTQAGDDLTDEQILNLDENTSYWWRVRYRDRELNWSDWSSPVAFTTGASIASPNLLLNPGAEDNLANWTIIEGVVEPLTAGVCNGITPHSGEQYFAVGGLCDHSDQAILVQDVDVSSYADSIDLGTFKANFGGYLSNFSGSDRPEVRILFLDQDSLEIDFSNTLTSLNSSWTLFSEWVLIPALTRKIRFELKGTRNAGTDNDSYFDDLFLKLGTSELDCSEITSIYNQEPSAIPRFELSPNPLHTSATIRLPGINSPHLKLNVINSSGVKMDCSVKYESERIVLEKGRLLPGIYYFLIRDQGQLIGTGKFVVI